MERSDALQVGEDGLPCPDVGAWTEMKHNFASLYAKLFSSGMKDKWGKRIYVELYAGAGYSRIRGTSLETRNVRKKQKPGDAVGRRSERSSLLSDPGAKCFCENPGRGTEQEKTGAGLSSAAGVGAVAAGYVAGQKRSRGLSRTHRARRRKSSTCQSATQIAFRTAVVAGKIWTSQTENRFHLGCRYVHSQQVSSQPQIDNAPVRLGKALPNTPTFRPALINAGGSVGCNRGRWITYARKIVGSIPHSRRPLCYRLRGRMQQLLCGRG